MGPAVLLIGVFAVGAYLLTRKKSASAGTTEAMTGPSGFKWRVESNTAGGNTYVMVTAPAAQFGVGDTSKDITALTYVVPAGKSLPRTLVSYGVNAPRPFIDAALKDFGVTVPSGVVLPKEATSGAAAYTQAKGKSGTIWQVVKSGNATIVGVLAGQLGLTQPAQVMLYRENASDPEHPRVLVSTSANLPSQVLYTALTDFQVSVPKGMNLSVSPKAA